MSGPVMKEGHGGNGRHSGALKSGVLLVCSLAASQGKTLNPCLVLMSWMRRDDNVGWKQNANMNGNK